MFPTIFTRSLLSMVHPVVETIFLRVVGTQKSRELVIRLAVIRPHGLISVADLDWSKPFVLDVRGNKIFYTGTHEKVFVWVFTNITVA